DALLPRRCHIVVGEYDERRGVDGGQLHAEAFVEPRGNDGSGHHDEQTVSDGGLIHGVTAGAQPSSAATHALSVSGANTVGVLTVMVTLAGAETCGVGTTTLTQTGGDEPGESISPETRAVTT